MGAAGDADKTLTSMVGTAAGNHFAGTVWSSRGKVFGEARVFERVAPKNANAYRVVEVIRIEASEKHLAIALLVGKMEEKFGPLDWIESWSASESSPVS